MVDIINIAQGSIEPPKAPEARSVKVSVKKVPATQKSSLIAYNSTNVELSTKSISIKTQGADIHIEVQPAPPRPISDVVSEANSNLQIINSDLVIEVDTELNQVIYKVIDVETGETIRQIPSEEMIRISKKLKAVLENYANRAENIPNLFMDTGSFA